jgi:hypothetical protein
MTLLVGRTGFEDSICSKMACWLSDIQVLDIKRADLLTAPLLRWIPKGAALRALHVSPLLVLVPSGHWQQLEADLATISQREVFDSWIARIEMVLL